MYSARISRNSPAAFVILIDQSGSMAERTVFNNESMSKAEAVTLAVNMLITELLNRSKKEDGYRDYFDIAVLGYHGDQVVSLLKDGRKIFMHSSEFVGSELSRVKIQKERRLPDGRTVVSVIEQPEWIRPCAQDKTPMYAAFCRCFEIVKAWCADRTHQMCYPPTIFNITDGESSDGDDVKLAEMASDIKKLATKDGQALLVNIHISSDVTAKPVLFPASEEELPAQRYARLLYRLSSTMPSVYNESIVMLRNLGEHEGRFKGISYNAGMTDLIGMMNIGSVSVNLLY